MMRRTYLAAATGLGAGSLAGCTASLAGGGVEMPIEVVLREWAVVPDASTLPAGEIEFQARNVGGDHHELVVRRRTEPDGRLETIAEVGDVEPGTFDWLTVTLEAGEYELACLMREVEENGQVEDHYRRGMHTTVTVE